MAKVKKIDNTMAVGAVIHQQDDVRLISGLLHEPVIEIGEYRVVFDWNDLLIQAQLEITRHLIEEGMSCQE